MSEPFLGEIRMFCGNFAPQGWAQCNGQLLPIAQYSALFSILGTTFGGNGTTNFALPNLQGKVAMNWGQSAGGSAYTIGQTGGSETVALTPGQMPAHNHGVNANAGSATGNPSGGVPATLGWPRGISGNLPNAFAAAPDGSTVMNAQMIQSNGGNQAHPNMQPFLCVTFIIALEGIYPSRP